MKLSYNDWQHAYWLDGKRCKGATTVAKIPEDPYRLHLWDKRMVAIGFAQKPELLEQVAVHYEDNRKLNEICEEAKKAAGAFTATTRGTTIHTVTERHDLGLEMIETEANAKIRLAYQAALDSAGLEPVPEYVERIVCYPDRLVAGRFDRIMRRKSDGKFVIVDAKSGAKAIDYPHAISIQLAIYANAPLMAGPIDGPKGETEVFEPLPENLDRKVAYVIHIPADDEARAVPIDIEAGWWAVENIVWGTLDWRARKDLVITSCGSVPIASPADTPAEKRPAEENSSGPPSMTSPSPSPSPTASDLAATLTTIKTNHPDLARIIAKRWPYPGVGLAELDEAQTGAVAALVDRIYVEGEKVDDADIALVQKKYTDLTKAQAGRVHGWLSEAEGPWRNGARPFGLGSKDPESPAANHSERRLALVESCVAVAQEGISDETFRALISSAMGGDAGALQASVPIGAALAAMNWREAQALFGYIRAAVGANNG